MSNSTKLEYIFSLQDRMSAKIGNITVSSEKMISNFSDMRDKQKSVTNSFNETGRTMDVLRNKIDLLQREREWIPTSNIEGIRAYNKEIKSLNKEITELESLNGGKLKKWSEEAFAALPGSNLIKNPLVAIGAGVAAVGKQAMSFDESMAKVNITAQLDGDEYEDMLRKMKQVAAKNKVDIAVTPVGFEAINSQINDVDLSMDILDASLKGSKAGFTDLDTVSSALAQTMSIVGKENASAMEVLDTFLTSKRVGAGEFSDFAKYMPTLIAGGSNLGINYKEVAGAFAYLTGKGQSADKSTVLLENAFTALSRGEIRNKMGKAGIKVFDENGSIRSLVDIFSDLSSFLSAYNDEQRSQILEGFGLVNKESKNAFAVLMSDTTKLRESMGEVAQSDGESDRALKYSQNSMMKLQENFAQLKNIGLEIGGFILPFINAGLEIFSGVLGGVATLVGGVSSGFAWWIDKMKEGNEIILMLTGIIGSATVVLGAYYAWQQKAVIIEGARNAMNLVLTGTTKLAAAGQWLLNTAIMGCPLLWVIGLIGAVAGAVMIAWNKFEWFREGILGAWAVIKEFGKSLFSSILTPFQQIISGIGAVGRALISLLKGDFSAAADEAKEGAKNILKGMVNGIPVGVAVNTFQKGNYKDAWEKGKEKGRESFANSQKSEAQEKTEPSFEIPEGLGEVPNSPDFDALMEKLSKGKKGTGTGSGTKTKTQKLDFTKDTTQNFAESAEYTAIKSTMAPKVTIPMPTVQLAQNKTEKPLSAPSINMAAPEVSLPEVPDAVKAAPAVSGVTFTDYKDEEKDGFLTDIMQNVRKIAAAISVPLALALPAESPATVMPDQVNTVVADTRNYEEYNTSTSESREIRIDNITIHIASADSKGEEDITSAVRRALMEALS